MKTNAVGNKVTIATFHNNKQDFRSSDTSSCSVYTDFRILLTSWDLAKGKHWVRGHLYSSFYKQGID